MTPYTTRSGLRIGLTYHRPLPSLTNDAEAIQAALLRHRMNILRTDNSISARLARFARRFAKWLMGDRP